MLVVEHRIGIGDGARHQRARVGRRRGHDDLQAGCAVEPGLGVLAVVRTGMTQPAPRHAHDHRHRSAPAVADLGGVVHELVEAGRDEVVELHLADRPLAGERGADAGAEHGPFGERRVEDAIAELLEQRPQQQERVAVRAADVLAEDEHRRVGAQARRRRRASPLRGSVLPLRSNGRRRRSSGGSGRIGVEVQAHLRIEDLDPLARRLAGEHALASLRRRRPAAPRSPPAPRTRRWPRIRLQAVELARVDEPSSLRAVPRRPGIGSRADQKA